MKEMLKKTFAYSSVLGVVSFFVLGSFNSIIVDKDAFMENTLNIKFAKRLDDIKGEYVIGRNAASIRKMNLSQLNMKEQADSVKTIASANKTWTWGENKRGIRMKPQVPAAKVAKKENKEEFEKIETRPEPAIKGDFQDMKLVGGLHNQKPIENLKDIEASASISNGEINEIFVDFPDRDEPLIIDTSEMVGNVFEFRDSETGEMQSGLIYEEKRDEKKGTVRFVVTLAGDTNYSNTRLAFEAPIDPNATLPGQEDNSNWGMNDQNDDNYNNEVADSDENDEDDNFGDFDKTRNNEAEETEYAQSDYADDEYADEGYDQEFDEERESEELDDTDFAQGEDENDRDLASVPQAKPFAFKF